MESSLFLSTTRVVPVPPYQGGKRILRQRIIQRPPAFTIEAVETSYALARHAGPEKRVGEVLINKSAKMPLRSLASLKQAAVTR